MRVSKVFVLFEVFDFFADLEIKTVVFNEKDIECKE